jgi:hypothetical protein
VSGALAFHERRDPIQRIQVLRQQLVVPDLDAVFRLQELGQVEHGKRVEDIVLQQRIAVREQHG